MTPEIEWVEGRPYLQATVIELEDRFAEVPDDVLTDAYTAFAPKWAALGLEHPKRSADELRRSVLTDLRQKAARAPRERRLPLSEAAKHLGLTERQLRHRVDAGEYDLDLVVDQHGRRLRFQPPARSWSLTPREARPDPRWALLSLDQRRALVARVGTAGGRS